jgi:phosphatidylglycerol:prolipoprotein diacylglycerol transferase
MSIPFPEIDPIAFSLGPIVVRWYALAYLTGFMGGWKYALHLCGLNSKNRPTRDDIDNFLPYAVLGVILGGRIGYVLFYQPALYAANPLDALKVWEGGMAFHGGILGVITSLILFSWLNKIQLLRLSDIICAVAPIGLFFGRIANFINGELFGRPTDAPWGVVFPWGGEMPRHPSQLYEAFLEGAVLFIILLILYKKTNARNHPGVVSGAFLIGYAAFRMIVEQFRQPDAHLGFIVGDISMGQLLSLPMLLLGLGVMTYALKDKILRRV